MYTKIVLALLMAAALLAACSTSEMPSESTEPQQTTSAAAGPGGLKEIQQQRSGDYVVVLLNQTGDLKQGANDLTLEFRRASDSQLADPGNVQMESRMEMKGMGPMMGPTNLTPAGTPGRYNVRSDLSMAGDWMMAVTFGSNQKVEFGVVAR